MTTWADCKTKGNSLFGLSRYKEALEQYSKAIEALENEEELSPSIKTEFAKLYSNRSVTFLKLASDSAVDKERFEDALKDGKKALEYDPSFHKAHLRCGNAYVCLERWVDVADCVSKVLAVYKAQATMYTDDSSLLHLMKQCKYFTLVKHKSPNWAKVKFKDNCKVIDPLGAGDYTDLSAAMNPFEREGDKVSYLVCAGEHRVTSELVVHPGHHVDVVGGGNSKEDVVFTASGSMFSPEACSIFAVMAGTLSLTHLSLNQTSNHPERHAVFSNHSSKVYMEEVKGYSKSSGCLGILDSTITMRKCELIDACGGVILTNKTTALIDSCKFTNCSKIGIELRDGSCATVLDTEVTGCGSQGIACHAEAKGFTLNRSKFHNNCRYLRSEPAVSVASGQVYVCDTRITDNVGGGIMAQNGGRVTVERCHISGGRYGVAASLQGSAVVTECHFEHLTFGVTVILNLKGNIRLENNTMKDVLREVQLTPEDAVPTMIGTQHAVEVNSGDHILGAGLKKSGKKDVKKLTQRLESIRWGDGECKRVCRPCGMSQSTMKHRFKQCSACRMSWYCGEVCQKKDWPLHKKECQKLKDLCGM